ELLPWMTFPTTNPTSAAMADRKIAFTPLINGYSWANLNDGLCPNRSVKNPDTTLVKATLSSTPAGVNTQAVYGEFGNTDADAIQSAIRQTTEVCAKAPTIPWCQAVDYFLNVGNAGTQVVSSLFATADANSTPYIGNDSVVTYTLTIANDQLNTTKMLYAIVETYGPVWLTAVNTPNTRPISIIAGGIYNYHTIVNPQLRDYVVLQIAPMAGNTQQTIQLPAIIDSNKAQASVADRIRTGTFAKLEVRLTDTLPVNNITGRTIEWLNNAIHIDTEAPTNVVPEHRPRIGVGQVAIQGTVIDDSAIMVTQMQYYTNVAPSFKDAECRMTTSQAWRCMVTIPTNATQLWYRVRASDIYGQLNQWSQWYSAFTDKDKPDFTFDAATQIRFTGAAAGGSSISLSGRITDTSSIASIFVCDYSTDDCGEATTTIPLATTTVI
ncbi:MAG: hypothetical protein ACK45X_01345, partial [Roseiflexaceae bacterium]